MSGNLLPMEYGLAGKVALVAAASKGIGLAIAQGLHAEGARVSIASRSEENLRRALELLPGAQAVPVDVRDTESLEQWVSQAESHFGPIDILVTNTGGPPAGALAQMTDEQWQEGFESTLLNVVRLVRRVQSGMFERNWGRIVHVTSLVAKEPNPILPISSTLRAGLMALTRLQATELAPFGVTVNAVLPGHTLTDRQRHLAEVVAEREGRAPEEILARTAASIPMGRLADPTEIAAAALFFCSQGASFVTGTSLLVDGGGTRGLG